MAIKIDHQIQDCDFLLKAVDGNRTAMTAKGFTEAKYTSLTSAKMALIMKEAAQQKAVKLVDDKTAEQNESIKTVTGIIQQVKNSGKSAYGKDARLLKIFKVGETIPASVGALRSQCEYFTALVLEHHDVLLENGLTQEDIDALNSSYGLLVSADASQENAKKLQVSATMMRDDASKKLKDQTFKTRSFAQTCFAKNPEILVQFKPLPKGGGRGGNGGTDNNPPTPPDNPPA
ncbi:MAG: hypothetical protein M1480_05960 [Bacteroidetes bacterium]|nr:hypothetical protein [Bacteroidota bacterium]